MLCQSCSGRQCRTLSTEQEPIDIECPSCNGHGCDKCEEGFVRLEGCPTAYCASIYTALDVIDMINKGHLPTSGGTMDQSAGIVHATHWFNNEEAKVRNEQLSRYPD